MSLAMEVDDKQHFKCWGCPSSDVSAVRTFVSSSNGYYGYMPRNIITESPKTPEPENAICAILAGRKRTYNEMCSGVNFVRLNNLQSSCKFKLNKVEETNPWLVQG